MKKVCVYIVLALLAGLLVVPSWGEVPGVINYQAVLTDANGDPLTGTHDLFFAIYSGSGSSADLLWTEEQDEIECYDGLFNVLLGQETPIPNDVFDHSERWLGISVDTDPEFQPRQRLTSVPYALRAEVADVAMQASGTGSTFVRWGSWLAPAGTDLVYSGYAYGPHYLHNAMEPVVLMGGDPHTQGYASGGMLYLLSTAEGTIQPPGIISDRYLRSAVCFSSEPTTVVWGSHNAPEGWEVLYRGYMLSSAYSHTGSVGPICVECDIFDSGAQNHSGATALLYGVVAEEAVYGSGIDVRKYLKCALLKKRY